MTIKSIFVDIEALVDEMHALPPQASVAREMRELRFKATLGSLAIAGLDLDTAALRALLERGVTLGTRPLETYLAARDYARGAAFVADQRTFAAGDPRPSLTVEEIRRLHVLVTAQAPMGTPGAWRQNNPPPHGAVVLPPPWLVPSEVSRLIDRMRRVDGRVDHAIAAFLTRFERIRPFQFANGRVARLAADLLLRRRDLPPFTVAVADQSRYRDALATATAGDRRPLETLVETAIATSCLRLIAAGTPDAPLLPLRTLAGSDYPALVKAAQRGRLRTVARNGRMLTTTSWIARYDASRSAAGRVSRFRER